MKKKVKKVKAWLYYPKQKSKMMATPRKYTAKVWCETDFALREANSIVLPCTITYEVPSR